MVTRIRVIAICVGTLLLGLNTIGLFIPLRNPELHHEPKRYKGPTLTEPQFLALSSRQDETVENYVKRLSRLVQESTVHYWKDEGMSKYHIRVPVYENYLLYLASYLNPDEYRKYEFCNYRKAIDRGVALCSQRAIILSQILDQNGIDSRIVGLNGHVVVEAQVDKANDTWWVADPDYGVVINRDIAAIQKDSEVIRPDYLIRGYDVKTIDNLSRIFRTEQRIYRNVKEYRDWKVYDFEYLSYFLIWMIPIALICPGLLPPFRRFTLAILSKVSRKQ